MPQKQPSCLSWRRPCRFGAVRSRRFHWSYSAWAWRASDILAAMANAATGKPIRLTTEIGADASLETEGGPAAILSRDGSRLAVLARGADGNSRIFVRALGQLLDCQLPSGATGAAIEAPFILSGRCNGLASSPTATASLKESQFTWPGRRNGDAVPMRAVTAVASWSRRRDRLSSPRTSRVLSERLRGRRRTGAADHSRRGAGKVTHSWPQILPGGQAVLFHVGTSLLS